MKVGQEVSYIDGESRQITTVVRIAGAGKSKAKVLDLAHGHDENRKEYFNVPYVTDAEPNGAYWLLKGEKKQPPEEEVVPEPLVDTTAFSEQPKRKKK